MTICNKFFYGEIKVNPFLKYEDLNPMTRRLLPEKKFHTCKIFSNIIGFGLIGLFLWVIL